MKLILKRLPNSFSEIPPFALYTEAGEMLPRQICVETRNEPGTVPTVTVTFALDGKDIKVVGDD